MQSYNLRSGMTELAWMKNSFQSCSRHFPRSTVELLWAWRHRVWTCHQQESGGDDAWKYRGVHSKKGEGTEFVVEVEVERQAIDLESRDVNQPGTDGVSKSEQGENPEVNWHITAWMENIFFGGRSSFECGGCQKIVAKEGGLSVLWRRTDRRQ